MDKIRTAIIGMGRMGRTRYSALVSHGGFKVVAVCDVNPANLTAYTKERGYTDWKECIDKSCPDAVVVCTFNAFIPEIVCYALGKGLAVFSEKPPGRNLSDTLLMKEAFEKADRPVLKYGFNHRYHNSVIEAKALVDSGILGEVVCARGVYGKAGNPGFAGEWRNNLKVSGGGILLDQGIHLLDLLYYFLGEFTEIKSEVGQLVWNDMSTEDSAYAILKTADGRVASLHSSAVQWRHKFTLDLICTEGFISLDGLITSTNSYGEEKLTYYRKDLEGSTGGLGNPAQHTLCFMTDESWAHEIEEFYDAVTGKIPVKMGTIDDAVNVMKMIEDIYGR